MNRAPPNEAIEPQTSLTAPTIAGVSRNVFALGITSFFADVSGETAVGLIEGVAEATASIVKVISGVWSDRIGRRMPLVVGGYGIAAVAKLL